MNYKEITEPPIAEYKASIDRLFKQTKEDIIKQVNSFSLSEAFSFGGGAMVEVGDGKYRRMAIKLEDEMRVRLKKNFYKFLEQSPEVIKTDSFFVFSYNEETSLNKEGKRTYINFIDKINLETDNGIGHIIVIDKNQKNKARLFKLRWAISCIFLAEEPRIRMNYGALTSLKDFEIFKNLDKNKTIQELSVLLESKFIYPEIGSHLDINKAKREIEKCLIAEKIKPGNTIKPGKV